MNVIIANKYKDALSNLDIDIIKKLDGEFDVDTIIDTFANFYYNRMIIDITSIKDYFNIATIQRLSAALDATKLILFLDNDPRFNNAFLSKIISLGIYNFTNDINGVMYLMNNPNSYRDVAQYHDLAMNDEKNLKEAKNASPFGVGQAFGGNPPAFGGGNTQTNANNAPFGGAVPFGGSAPANNSNMGGFAPNMTMSNNNNTQETTKFQPWLGPSYNGSMDPNFNNPVSYNNSNTKVIGFKDLTEDAGATTLVYMLKKNLTNRKVLAVEINNNDFSYFGDSELMSVSDNNLGNLRSRFSQFDIVLIDLNGSMMGTDGTCTDIVYLLEPSTIKLNKLMRKDRQALEKIKDQKIVLNKSLLTVSDVKEFEYEAKVKMFYNIPPLDERKDSQMVLDSFLEKLGINSSGGSGGLFGMFKK